MNVTSLVAVLAPLLLGRAAVAAIGPRAGNAAERWGHAWLLGMALLAAMMILLGFCGAPLTRTTLGIAVVVAAAVMAVVGWRRARSGILPDNAPISNAPIVGPSWPMVGGLCLLVALRIFWVAAEVRLVPEHFNDAYENWLLRGKVIAAQERLPLDRGDPFYLGGGRISYPLGMPLQAAWCGVLNGTWTERIVNPIWLAYFLALLAVVGGFLARRLGVAAGLAGAYVISSLPMVGIHAARSGYVDLLLAAHLTAACLMLWDDVDSRQPGARTAGLAHLLFCVLLKREGLLFFFIILLSWIVVSRVQRSRDRTASPRLWPTYAAAAIAALGLAAMADLTFLQREAAAIGFHSEAVGAIRTRLFAWDSWNLLWWFVAAGLPVAGWRLWRGSGRIVVVQAVLLLSLTLAVFVFTANAAFAVNGWTLDRSMLQIAPIALVAVMLGILPRPMRDRSGIVAREDRHLTAPR
ncbi:MAG: hypothetical protein V3T70_01555, partial [Phycisphaerae bacterium]